MNNITLNTNIHDCTGCGICSAVCPTSAIQILLSTDGFYEPVVNTEKCIDCGKCIKTCYKFDKAFVSNSQKTENVICFSAKNLDKNELSTSSSGAVSIELMKTCISLGYKVVGVAYNYTKNRAETRIAESYDQLEQFKGSKYFQSYTSDVFRQILADKTNQKYAIFGTPCQIYAFSRLREYPKFKDKFLLVDIFCHGCPSFTLWKKYLEYQSRKHNNTVFDKITFRSKSLGWHEFCFDFSANNESFTSSKFDDPFFKLFFSNDILSASCYDCISRSSIEKTDIRLGDFWGWRHDMDTEGVSAVVICSSLGEQFFQLIKDKFSLNDISFEEVIREQSYGTIYNVSADRRLNSLALINSELTLEEIVKQHKHYLPFKVKISNYLKNLVRRLPQVVLYRLKYYFHKI